MPPPVRRTVNLRQAFRRRVVRQYFVRFHMTLMISASIAAALIAGKVLLESGLTSVLGRYPICVLAGYLSFLGFIRLWAMYVLSHFRTSPALIRLPDDLDITPPASSSRHTFGGFGGGSSGGGGASDSWGASLPSVDMDGDVDEGIWIVLLLAALVLALLGAGVYVVWIAPQLLPDVALNLLLAPAVRRAANRAETSSSAFGHMLRHTWIPFSLILLLSFALAAAVHHRCPDASKISEALTCPPTP